MKDETAGLSALIPAVRRVSRPEFNPTRFGLIATSHIFRSRRTGTRFSLCAKSIVNNARLTLI